MMESPGRILIGMSWFGPPLTRRGCQPGVCLYTLRHSFITQSLMDGMTTLDVARISGTSLGMIERHYGHLVMNAARERLELVNLL